ncbi:hypothetical protein F511_33651 [Dorcoceras hygrometricum]|uniref:Uncharacterized protein n=1 Tax=Dorcoceras hygrometricum TaxID=472368 RepID=A0A2Z7C011_9LAMI|nr:hypothetical protein F511_33651 [Dorcoceras hygrometricum]
MTRGRSSLSTRALRENADVPGEADNTGTTLDNRKTLNLGPRPDTRLLRQPALEGLTRSARTDSPRKIGRNNFRRTAATTSGGGGGVRRGREAAPFALGLGFNCAMS